MATGYSGNAEATAFAPNIFVRFESPTKNSRPFKFKKFLNYYFLFGNYFSYN